jgi:hypothetical protein
MQQEFEEVKETYLSDLRDLRVQETINMKNSIRQAIQNHFNQFLEVYNEFKKFFNQEHLSEKFSQKADKE